MYKYILILISFYFFLGAKPIRSEPFKLTQIYKLRISGISLDSSGQPYIYAVLETPQAEFFLDKLMPKDCYQNFCFDGLSADKKNIVIAYKLQNIWQRKLIPVHRQNTRIPLEMYSMDESENIIESTLSLLHKFFPETLMIDITDDQRRPFLFKNGKLIAKPLLQVSEEQLTKQIKDQIGLTDILSYLSSHYQIKQENGVATLGPAVSDCTQFRSEILKKFNRADELRALQHRLLVLCKLEDQTIGYCDSDVISMFSGKSECEEKEVSGFEFNSCGGLKSKNNEIKISSQFYKNNWLNAVMLSKEGNKCAIDSQQVDIEVKEKTGTVESFTTQTLRVNIKDDSQKNGVCVQGQCVSIETNPCIRGINDTVQLFFEENNFYSLFGVSFQEITEINPESNEQLYSNISQFVSKKSNRDIYRKKSENEPLPNLTICPGGVCQNGECIPFEDILKKESTSNSYCEGLENGNPCEFLTKNSSQPGACFRSQCYICDENSSEKLVGLQCPENSFYADQLGYRRSCKTPDICSYR